MFFTKAGGIVAWLAAVFGVAAVVAGYEFDINQADSVVAEILKINATGWNGQQGRVFREQGFILLFCGLVLGVLCDISRSAVGKSEDHGE